AAPGPSPLRLRPRAGRRVGVWAAGGRRGADLPLLANPSVRKAQAGALPFARFGLFAGGKNDAFRPEGRTDGDGRFRIEGLLPGLEYELLLPLDKGRFPNPPFSIPRGLTVEPGRD